MYLKVNEENPKDLTNYAPKVMGNSLSNGMLQNMAGILDHERKCGVLPHMWLHYYVARGLYTKFVCTKVMMNDTTRKPSEYLNMMWKPH
jgi:hypothetical protein